MPSSNSMPSRHLSILEAAAASIYAVARSFTASPKSLPARCKSRGLAPTPPLRLPHVLQRRRIDHRQAREPWYRPGRGHRPAGPCLTAGARAIAKCRWRRWGRRCSSLAPAMVPTPDPRAETAAPPSGRAGLWYVSRPITAAGDDHRRPPHNDVPPGTANRSTKHAPYSCSLHYNFL